MAEPPRIHIPSDDRPDLERAVREGGGELAALEDADGLVWLGGKPGELPELPGSVRWVQLPSAGVEQWLRAGRIDGSRAWTSATGAFGLPVAEHALALMLAGDKALHAFARETSWVDDGRHHVRALEGETVTIVGAGGIGRALMDMLEPHDVEVLAVTRSGRDGTLPVDRIDEIWPKADHFVIAAPATDATKHIVGEAELAAMQAHSWIVNIARGSLIDTDALVAALDRIGGAALDVTDPEPLPDGHPLWEAPNVLITPHVANPPSAMDRDLAKRVQENVRRFGAGEELEAPVSPENGY